MTPETEQIAPEDLQNDQSRMSDLLTKVSADGHDVLDEAPEPQEPEVVTEPEVVEPEIEPVGDETPPAAATETAPPAEDAPQDDYEREIEEKYQPPKGASQRTTEVLKILKRINREEHRKAKVLEKEKQELESRKFLDENTEKELQDLRDLRSRVAIEQDPEFNEKYVQKIQQHEGRAMAILKHHEMPEDTIKYINEQGGLVRFQNSERLMPQEARSLPTEEYPEGKPFHGTQAEWYREVIKPMIKTLPEASQTRLKYELEQALRTAIQRDDALQEARGNPQKFIEQRQQSFQADVEQYAKRADAQLEKESDLYGEIAKPKEVPEKATAEQKAEIAAHNARLENARGSIRQGFADVTPEHRAQAEAALAYRDFAQNHVKEVEKKLADKTKAFDELQSKWDAAKNKAQTSRQQSSVAQVKDRQQSKPYDAGESIRELLEKVPA